MVLGDLMGESMGGSRSGPQPVGATAIRDVIQATSVNMKPRLFDSTRLQRIFTVTTRTTKGLALASDRRKSSKADSIRDHLENNNAKIKNTRNSNSLLLLLPHESFRCSNSLF